MELQNTTTELHSEKWQKMLLLLKQSQLPQLDYSQHFKKLVFVRLLQRNLIIFLLQYAGLMFTTLKLPSSSAWFASGTAAAFIFLRGYDVLPGLWLGGALAYFFAGLSPWLAAAAASILAIQAWVLLQLNYRLGNLSLVFNEKLAFIQFLGLCALVTGTGSFVLASLCYTSLATLSSFNQIVWQWSLANFNGTLILGCALSTWDAYFPDIQKLKNQNKIDLILYFALLTVASLGFIFSKTPWLHYLLMILSGLLMIKISRRYKWCGSVAMVFLLALILSLANLFQPLLLASQPLQWEFFLSFCAISGLFMGL